jgi:hypothetical protein
MTLQQWIDKEIENIGKFQKDWTEKNKEDPENYPMEMFPGYWYEQYLFYDGVSL